MVIVELLFPAGVRNTIRRAAVEAGYGFHGQEASLRAALVDLPGRLIDNVLERPDIPRLVIQLDLQSLKKLYDKRERALDTGFLVQEEDDFVPAKVGLGRTSVSARLRLKGDMVDHIRTSKWSFRIHTRGEDHVFGMRRFSIQHPETRGFQAEVLFLQTLRRLGVLAPRYFFVDVSVNGNEIGLMALEEHFSTELLESNGRRDGVIVRFDESLMWADRVARGPESVREQGPFDTYLTAPVTTFRTSKVMASPRLRREYEVAAGLLRAFAEGELGAAEVFDVVLLGRFLAAAELWGAWHPVGWNNQRFYFNPLTMKLEPIGYDAHIEGGIGSGTVISRESLASRMLEDPEVRAAFEAALGDLVREVESGSLIGELDTLQSRTLRELRAEFPLLEPMDLTALRDRGARLPFPAHTPEQRGPFGAQVLAYTVSEGESSYLEISNPLPLEVEVTEIRHITQGGAVETPLVPAAVKLPLVLPGRTGQELPARRRIGVDSVPDADGWIEVTSRLAGESETTVTRSMRGVPRVTKNPMPKGDLEGLLAGNPFLGISADGAAVEVAPGRWQVSGSLVVPPGIELRVPAGTTLQFQRDAGLIAYGPTIMAGTETGPIVLEPRSDAAGGLWQGIVVHGAHGRSHWSRVTIRGTVGVIRDAWVLTGGTTFYRSDVTMSRCVFSDSMAEDALNIVHSDFELLEVEVRDTASDGLDSDFSRGRIRGGAFTGIGHGTGADGLDISGTELALTGTLFSRITDKAISVGERSRLTASEVVIEHSMVGAASKDASTLMLSDSTVRHASLAGLMSYMKKAEYGGAELVAEDVTILDTPTLVRVQHGSLLRLNGIRAESEALDVEQLYRVAMRRGNPL